MPNFERNKNPIKSMGLGRPFGFSSDLKGEESNDGHRTLYVKPDFVHKIGRPSRRGTFYFSDGFYARYGKGGLRDIYKCELVFRLVEVNGVELYKIYGYSGDFGFKGGQRTQKETLGVRTVKYVYKQCFSHLEKLFYGKS